MKRRIRSFTGLFVAYAPTGCAMPARIANNGCGLISNNSAGVVSGSGASFRLLDAEGNLFFFVDTGNRQIKRVSASGLR